MATLEPEERRRFRDPAGTTVYITDLDPEVLRVLTLRKVVDYLRRRRATALARGDYTIEVIEGRTTEIVTPERPDGLRIDLPPLTTLWGRLELNLYVAPRSDRGRRVAVVGRGGISIIDDLCELEEFDGPPWNSDQVSGQIAFDGLAQTAGRRAIVRDRDAFPIFLDAVRRVEPHVQRALERVTRQVDQEVATRLSETVRRIFGRVLKELADLENPMRAPVGDVAGGGAIFEAPSRDAGLSALNEAAPAPAASATRARDFGEAPRLDVLDHPPSEDVEHPLPSARPDHRRTTSLPTLAPDPSPGSGRSRFDEELGVVLFNEGHPDYLRVKDDEGLLLDYLATLVAKEYVVYNNPRASSDEVAEEMVRLLVRLRRHLQVRRR